MLTIVFRKTESVGRDQFVSIGKIKINSISWRAISQAGRGAVQNAWANWHDEELAIEYDEIKRKYFEAEFSTQGEVEAEWVADWKVVRSISWWQSRWGGLGQRWVIVRGRNIRSGSRLIERRGIGFSWEPMNLM